MCNSDRRHFLGMAMVTLGAVGIAGVALAADPAPKKTYVCPPCGCAADGKAELAKPQDGGGALMARQDRAAPHLAEKGAAWTGKRERVSRQVGAAS